jgi:polygalacturonase
VTAICDVTDFGAVGDGRALDTTALQDAIDACAAAGGGRVIVPGTRWYRTGTIRLRDRVNLHLDDGATLVASLRRADYAASALIVADGASGIAVTGHGRIEGRATDFMTAWDDSAGLGAWIYTPAAWRPRMFALRGCSDVTVADVTMAAAPYWGLHLLDCEHVGVERLRVRNNLEVPNCDGVDIDHSRDVEVRDCSIHTGDDAIVVKATGRAAGAVRGIWVHDCELVTQDSALKIGTETAADISDVRFERCAVPSANRACAIQLRDAGDVHGVTFSDITFSTRYFATPWWGHGEAISVTALPRTPDTVPGKVSGVTFRHLAGNAENSVRLDGSVASRLTGILLEDVHVTLRRWTSFPGGVFDDRPTTVRPALVPHDTPGISICRADGVTLRDTSVAWAGEIPPYFGHALVAADVTRLDLRGFRGEAARPGLPAVVRRDQGD